MDQHTVDRIASILTAQGALLKRLEDESKVFQQEIKSLTSQIVVLRAEIEDLKAPMAVAAPAKGRKAR